MTLDPENVARAWITEVITKKNVDEAVRLFLAPGFRPHPLDIRESVPDLAGLKAFLKDFHAAFPDAYANIEDCFASGDRVAARVRIDGTHHGPFMGIPPTRRPVSVNILANYRVQNGKLTDAWTLWDFAGLFKQLGVSAPGTPPAAR